MPGVARLGAEDAVELGRMAAALVDLQVQLARVQDDRESAARALRRGQQRDRLVGERFRTLGEPERADVLVAGGLPTTARVGVRPALMLVAVDGVRLHGGPDVGDRLLGERAVGRGEGLPLALGRVHRFGEGDALDPAAASSAARRSPILRSSGTVNGSSSTGVSNVPVAGGRSSRTVGSRRAVALARAMRTASPATRSTSSHRQDVAAREAPRAVDEDADAEALALPGGDALDATGLDRDRFVEPADDADVRIPGAQGRGRIEGALGQVSHAAAQSSRGFGQR